MTDELLKEAFKKPSILDEIDPEWMPTGTEKEVFVRDILMVMQELHQRGIIPTPTNVAEQGEHGQKATILANIRSIVDNVDSQMGADYIIAAMREEWSRGKVYSAMSTGLSMYKEGESATSIAQSVFELLRTIPSQSGSITVKKALVEVMDDLERIYRGEEPPMWKTGMKQVDDAFKWAKRSIVLLAALQKVGKSRLALALVMMLLKNQPHLKCIWFSFEMSHLEMIVGCLAHLTGIPTGVINGKDRMPTEQERAIIRRARALLENIPIEFVSKRMRIGEMGRVIAKNADENTIAVIDNFGLIVNEPGMGDNQNDDFISGELVSIRDTYNPLIILLHHLSKENTNWTNKKDFFEPKIRQIRGSARIADYVNHIGLLHRIEMFESELKGSEITYDAWPRYIGKMELILASGREGPGRHIHLEHQLESVRFKEWEG